MSSLYEDDIEQYAVVDNWIVGKTKQGWFAVNWWRRIHEKFATEEDFRQRLSELGVLDEATLRPVPR